jgi:hypothetical protein
MLLTRAYACSVNARSFAANFLPRLDPVESANAFVCSTHTITVMIYPVVCVPCISSNIKKQVNKQAYSTGIQQAEAVTPMPGISI